MIFEKLKSIEKTIEGTEYFAENNYLLKDYELYGFDNFGNKA